MIGSTDGRTTVERQSAERSLYVSMGDAHMTVSRVLILLLVAGVSVPLAAQSDKSPAPKKAEVKKPDPNQITLTLKTKTGTRNKFATANAEVYLLINGDAKHKFRLDNPRNDDFKLGATDTFKNIPVNMPLEKVKSIRIESAGDDLWYCESIGVQFFQKKLQSREYKFPCGRYISAGREKKAFNATPFVDFKITRKPELAPPEKETPKEEKPG